MALLCHLILLLLATSALGLELLDEPEESMEELEQRLATDIANTAILIGHEVHKPWHLNRGERKRWESHHQRVANDPAGFLLRASRAPRGAANIDWAHSILDFIHIPKVSRRERTTAQSVPHKLLSHSVLVVNICLPPTRVIVSPATPSCLL